MKIGALPLALPLLILFTKPIPDIASLNYQVLFHTIKNWLFLSWILFLSYSLLNFYRTDWNFPLLVLFLEVCYSDQLFSSPKVFPSPLHCLLFAKLEVWNLLNLHDTPFTIFPFFSSIFSALLFAPQVTLNIFSAFLIFSISIHLNQEQRDCTWDRISV